MKKSLKNKVMKHLKKDVKNFKHEAREDKKLMKSIKSAHKKHKPKVKKYSAKKYKFKDKIEKVMHEFKKHELHSGSKKGPKVKNPKQAIAIALSEARKAGKKIKKKSK